MKNAAKIALKFVLLSIPMAIAACYGMAAQYSRRGKVIDKATHDPLSDIKVECLKGGSSVDEAISYNGDWTIYTETCDSLKASDTKAPARYQTTTVTEGVNVEGVTIQMDKVP